MSAVGDRDSLPPPALDLKSEKAGGPGNAHAINPLSLLLASSSAQVHVAPQPGLRRLLT